MVPARAEPKPECGRSLEAEALRAACRRYRLPKPDYDTLKFPARDAESLAEALHAQKGGLYSDVQIEDCRRPRRASKGKAPTRDNVLDGLYWLKHAATSRDISIVFLSGHGIRDAKQKFWFLTRDADTERLRATAISNDDLLDLVARSRGKRFCSSTPATRVSRWPASRPRRLKSTRHEQGRQ